MDTEYTKGFKAGMAWREAEIIKLLEELKGPEIASCDDCLPYAERESNYLNTIIALIKGEQ